ncbi:MAG TPA: hydrogenase iron-sulfur subunit, partial [Fimbriimonadaceae bacterium]|nr:hydrogenase iron-sulfur subunit [Fimbriimonadaceae bacterium]
MTQEFEPKILTFCCTWCSYQAADLAGTSRKKYSSCVRLVRVPCSGRVDPWFV